MRITLIRHLPTEWNRKAWLQGRRDTDITYITKEYKQGIGANKKLLLELGPFDFVLASTLKRTHQTAEAYGYEVETEGLLDELDFGCFEGLPKEKMIEKHRDLWIENPKELVLGESLVQFEGRILSFLTKYQSTGNILVFGHGSWIRALLSYHHYGDINHMNKMNIDNNECFIITIP